MPPNDSGVNMARAGVAEFVGTFILVFAGTAVVTAAALGRPIAGPPLNSLAVGLTFGLVLTLLVGAFAHVSGAHFNPAVTLGLFSVGRFPGMYAVVYIIAQIVGAIAAAAAVWAVFGDAARQQASLGATFPTAGTSDAQAFLMEVLITFILVFTIVAISTDERANTTLSSISIGFALGVAVLVGGAVSGGSANPARTLGPMIVAGKFTSLWVYIIGPIVGGVVAAMLYRYVIGKAEPPRPAVETTVTGQAR
ncbi:MAG: MIP family channel protein [Armatimonadota bacterium]|nr:MIP family channel protein [bacterium]